MNSPAHSRCSSPPALILDLDGTLLRGNIPLPGIQELFGLIHSRQIPFLILTNNATRSPEDYQRKLSDHGIHIQASKILTAGMATAVYLQKEFKPGSRLYMIGQLALRTELENAGFIIVPDASEDVKAVVVGGDPGLTYAKLKDAGLHLQRGARLVGTNPDVVYPTEEGLVPETGTTLAALQAASDVNATVIGKPSPALFNLAVERLDSDPEHTFVIGDRLETDIIGGIHAGLRTILITTGVDTRAGIEDKGIHPDWVVDSLIELMDLLKAES